MITLEDIKAFQDERDYVRFLNESLEMGIDIRPDNTLAGKAPVLYVSPEDYMIIGGSLDD